MNDSNIQFEFDEAKTKLYATFNVPENDTSPTVNRLLIKNKLKSDGYEELYYIDKGIEEVISCFNTPTPGEGEICIAERRDAEVSISLPKDKMSAFLTIVPAAGGKDATLDIVKQALSEKGIRFGFLPKAIKEAILLGEADGVKIAQGNPITNGDDAKFTCLIKNIKLRTPNVSEDGHIDYRDLGEIQVVHPNDKLMRRKPATMGKSSKNIFGEIINPTPGKDRKFASGLEGAEPSPKNPNILIATVTGQPVICDNGVNVEKTMTAQNVDLKSGNIIFDGSVIVEGDVASGMKVEASGDVKITGIVENAIIVAGGDINIKGAIVGRSENNAPVSENLVKIDAKGSVSAKFIENAHVSSGNKIMVQDWVIKSTLSAVNEIIVGKKEAKKGQIIGGSTTSGILVKAMNIGSSAGVTTHIQVGNADDIDKRKDQIGIRISKKSKELIELQKVFKELRSNPTDHAKNMLKKALISKQQIEQDIIELRAIEMDLEKERKRARNAKVVVAAHVYAGTLINISKYKQEVQEDIGGRTFLIKGDKIIQGT